MMVASVEDPAQRRLGIALVLASALAWSFGGIFAKLVSVDAWTAAVFRALAASAFLVIVLLVQYRGSILSVLLRSARAAPASILIGALSMVLLIGAFFNTSVANVIVIYATAPFWAAAMLWLMSRIVPGTRTIIASAMAMIGVVIVVAGGLAAASYIGDLLALAMTVTFIYAAIALRRAPSADATAVTLLSCLVCAAVCAPLATPSSVSSEDLLWLTLFGVMTSGIAYVCFMAGARLISTTEAGLLGVTEIALAPFWSFLILAEIPPGTTFLGGGLIVATVLWFLLGQEASSPNQSRDPA
jgi:drug/metabolite transporter (DMT)-like permease